MKHIRKTSSPYFKKRDSFQSPECSTVVEVNPSCESEESMLEKIIFPDQASQNYHNQKGNYEREALQQKNLNSINVNRNFGKVNKNYKYLDDNAQPKFCQPQQNEKSSKENLTRQDSISHRYQSFRSSKDKYESENIDKSPRQRLNSISSTNSTRNLMERTTSKLGIRLESYQSNELNKKYSTQKYNFPDENDSRTQIDEVKLHEIQQKIKRYQNKNRQPTYQSKQIHRQTAKKTSFRDTMESQLNKIQIDFFPPPQNKLKKKMTIIENISFEKENFPAKFQPQDFPNLTLKEQNRKQKSQANFSKQSQRNKINSEHQRVLERCLQKIYSLVLINNQLQLSSDNINLKTLSVEEVKLILGPIFTEVKIRNKAFSKQLFVEKAIDALKTFMSEQIEEIVKLFARETEYIQSQSSSAQSSETHTRMPGRLLSQSKVGSKKDPQIISNKRFSSINKKLSNSSNALRTNSNLRDLMEVPSLPNHQNSQKTTLSSKVTKNVYIEPTEKTEGDEEYFSRYRERYERQINLNENALEIMLAEQKNKKFVSKNRNNEKREVFEEDDELQRLQQLERKFNEHFNSRK